MWLALIWQAIPDALVMRTNLASPAEEGSKLRLLIFPSIALVLYLLLTHAERIGALNLPDLGSPERNVQAARQAAAVLKAISVSLIMLIQLTVLTTSPVGSAGLWLLFAGLVVGLFVIQLIWRQFVKDRR